MKILNITTNSTFPVVSGAARLTYGFTKYLSKKINTVLVTVKSNDSSKYTLFNTKVYDCISGNPIIKFLSPFTYFKIIQIINVEKPDYIIINAPWYGLFAIFIKYFFGIKFLVMEHNVEYLRFKRFKKWWWIILKYYEIFIYNNAHKILCISDSDKNIIANDLKIEISKLIDCPYGIDEEIFYPDNSQNLVIRKQLEVKPSEKIVLFFGPLDYRPNTEALDQIINVIYPKVIEKKSDIKFVIVGRNPPLTNPYKNIIFTGQVDKIQNYINIADVVIVPLLTGGGVRTKIFESIACGKHVISTKIGAEGINSSFNGRLKVVNSIDKFSDEIIKILKTYNNSKSTNVEIKKYGWDNIVDKFVTTI